MVGAAIISYGAYVPRHRLRREAIAQALGGGAGSGARAIAAYDEDTTSMGVEAARRALAGDGAPAALYFATTAPAYFDKTNAAAIHAALGLGHQGFAVDLAGAVRCGVGALRAAAADGGLAVLADVRTGRPGSSDERDGGDAAVAFHFGPPERAIAEIVASTSATAEFLDRWRVPGESASRLWEERFGLDVYLPLIEDVAARALSDAGVEVPDHLIVSSPHARAARTAAARLPGEPAAHLQEAVGYSGVAAAGLELAALLDRAAPDETILMVTAADGCDAIVLRTTPRVSAPREPLAGQLAAGRDVPYATYLGWRGLLEREPPRRPEPVRPAGPPSARAEEWKFAFVGSRCSACGQVHLPPQRVCAGCGAVDRMEPAPLASKQATVATYTIDRLAYSPSPPVIDVVLDYDGGGRYCCQAADAAPEEIAIGDRMEMTFRRLYTTDGVHNYFWKARPLADQTEVS